MSPSGKIFLILGIIILFIAIGVGIYFATRPSDSSDDEETPDEAEEMPNEAEEEEEKESVPDFMYMDPNGASTWNDTKQKCEDAGMNLCTRDKLCPEGPLKDPIDGMIPGADVWAPVGDEENEWASIGNYDPSNRLCKTHTEVAGETPAWGINDASPWLKKIPCCK